MLATAALLLWSIGAVGTQPHAIRLHNEDRGSARDLDVWAVQPPEQQPS